MTQVKINNRIKERILSLKKQGKTIDGQKITFRNVAKIAGISYDYLWRLIRGERHASQLLQFKLANILECDIGYLFFAQYEDTQSANYELFKQQK